MKHLRIPDPSKSVSNYVIFDDILHYSSDLDGGPVLRLCIPSNLQVVLKQYNDFGHLGADKCYDSIKRKYF